jgi:hypothetical protein
MKECGAACSSMGSHFEKKCCFINCTLASNHLLNSDGHIDNEAMINYLIEKVCKNDAWTEPIKKSIEECAKEGKKRSHKFLNQNNMMFY